MADKDRSGSITKDELKEVFQNVDPETYTDARIEGLMHRIDEDGSGTIDYQEFVTWIMSGDGPEENILWKRRFNQDLPEGWEAVWSKSKRCYYYVNRRTRARVWDKPGA